MLHHELYGKMEGIKGVEFKKVTPKKFNTVFKMAYQSIKPISN